MRIDDEYVTIFIFESLQLLIVVYWKYIAGESVFIVRPGCKYIWLFLFD